MRRTPSLSAPLAILAVLLASTPCGAHAVLKTSTLPERVRPGEPSKVTLGFNSAVEPALSRVVLVDEARRETVLAVRAGSARNEVAVDLPALDSGRWALRYKVLAADGHVTESVLRFTVSPRD